MSAAGDAPDILVIGAEWPARALLCAQLIEDGHKVVAADAWPVPRIYFQTGAKPRAVIVDLHGLPDPQAVIEELPALATPEHTVVIASLGSVPVHELRRLGFHVVARPASVGDIAARIKQVLANP